MSTADTPIKSSLFRVSEWANKKPVGCLLHAAWVIFRHWRWGRHISPKRRLNFIGLHCVMSRKIELFITTAVRTSSPKLLFFPYHLVPSVKIVLWDIALIMWSMVPLMEFSSLYKARKLQLKDAYWRLFLLSENQKIVSFKSTLTVTSPTVSSSHDSVPWICIKPNCILNGIDSLSFYLLTGYLTAVYQLHIKMRRLFLQRTVKDWENSSLLSIAMSSDSAVGMEWRHARGCLSRF
jgi:hypothetical protein